MGYYAWEEPGTVMVTDPPEDDAGALEWVRERWASFENLSADIIDLQHRAALASQSYRERGLQAQADLARAIIEELAKLQRVHHRILTWAEQAGGALGIGAVQIPLGIAGISVVALLVAWSFRKYNAQREALELLEAGILTPAQFERLDILDPPGIGSEIGGVVGNVGMWALLIIGALLLLEISRGRGTLRPNPPVLLMGNPPGPMSDEVGGVFYEHVEDGEWYIHEFAGGVQMEALEDGTVLLSHPDHPVWKEF